MVCVAVPSVSGMSACPSRRSRPLTPAGSVVPTVRGAAGALDAIRGRADTPASGRRLGGQLPRDGVYSGPRLAWPVSGGGARRCARAGARGSGGGQSPCPRERGHRTSVRLLAGAAIRPPSVTQLIYRHQIRPVLQTGAVAMDSLFGTGDADRLSLSQSTQRRQRPPACDWLRAFDLRKHWSG